MTQMHGAPLIMDYIKHESRGKATALNSLGHLLGESFAMAVLFSISTNGRFTEAESFAINACIIACMGAPLYCLVRNVEIKKPLAEPAAASFVPDTETSVNNNAPADVPQLEAHQNEAQQPEEDGKLRKLYGAAWDESRRDPKYIICFLGASIFKLNGVLFSNFIVLWLTSFVDDGLITEERSQDLYQRLILIAIFPCIVFAPLFGLIADKVPSKVLVPVAFSLRGAIGYAFLFIKDPESVWATLISVTLIVFTLLEAVSIEILFFRGLPGHIRGTMVGIMAFCGHVGLLIFTFLAGMMFDGIGRNAPFVFLAILDCCFVAIVLVMVSLGKLTK